MLANIAQRSSTEQSIADCVQQHIAIRVGYTPLSMGYLHPAKHQAQTLTEGVNIVSVTYSKIHIVR